MAKQPIEVIASMLGGEKNPSNLKAASLVMDQLNENGWVIVHGSMEPTPEWNRGPSIPVQDASEAPGMGHLAGASAATRGNTLGLNPIVTDENAIHTLRREADRLRKQASNLEALAVALGKLVMLREGQADQRIDRAVEYLMFRHRT